MRKNFAFIKLVRLILLLLARAEQKSVFNGTVTYGKFNFEKVAAAEEANPSR